MRNSPVGAATEVPPSNLISVSASATGGAVQAGICSFTWSGRKPTTVLYAAAASAWSWSCKDVSFCSVAKRSSDPKPFASFGMGLASAGCCDAAGRDAEADDTAGAAVRGGPVSAESADGADKSSITPPFGLSSCSTDPTPSGRSVSKREAAGAAVGASSKLLAGGPASSRSRRLTWSAWCWAVASAWGASTPNRSAAVAASVPTNNSPVGCGAKEP
mmetsp:Transcript_84240/g.212422  ORF Transcript_84240/g.212422 Transcript_84240/m.212422 type:complete len:217 (-) Transcript_84240:303-953(-)